MAFKGGYRKHGARPRAIWTTLNVFYLYTVNSIIVSPGERTCKLLPSTKLTPQHYRHLYNARTLALSITCLFLPKSLQDSQLIDNSVLSLESVKGLTNER